MVAAVLLTTTERPIGTQTLVARLPIVCWRQVSRRFVHANRFRCSAPCCVRLDQSRPSKPHSTIPSPLAASSLVARGSAVAARTPAKTRLPKKWISLQSTRIDQLLALDTFDQLQLMKLPPGGMPTRSPNRPPPRLFEVRKQTNCWCVSV